MLNSFTVQTLLVLCSNGNIRFPVFYSYLYLAITPCIVCSHPGFTTGSKASSCQVLHTYGYTCSENEL